MTKMCPKIADIGNFCHIFTIVKHFIGPLVVKLLHILVEEVMSFEMSGVTSKSVKN